MTGPVPLALALIAVLALIGLTHLLGFSRTRTLSGPDQAAALAQGLPGGFNPCDIVIACDRRGALLRDGTGRVALVAGVGAHFLVREAEQGWDVRPGEAGRLAIRGGDFSAVLDLGSDQEPWFAALVDLPSGRG